MLSSHFSLRAPTTVGRKKKNSTFINFFLFTNQHHWPVIKIRKLRSDSEIIPSQFLVSGGHWSPWWQGSFANHSGLPLFWVSPAFFLQSEMEIRCIIKRKTWHMHEDLKMYKPIRGWFIFSAFRLSPSSFSCSASTYFVLSGDIFGFKYMILLNLIYLNIIYWLLSKSTG